MIIIDTSVWIAFFKGEKEAGELKDLIVDNEIILHPYVYGELLLGGLPRHILPLIESLNSCEVVEREIVFNFIKKQNIISKGIGWVDINILASAKYYKHTVHTFDVQLASICKKYKCLFNF